MDTSSILRAAARWMKMIIAVKLGVQSMGLDQMRVRRRISLYLVLVLAVQKEGTYETNQT